MGEGNADALPPEQCGGSEATDDQMLGIGELISEVIGSGAGIGDGPDTSGGRPSSSASFLKLRRAAKGRTASEREVVRWAFEHMTEKPSDIAPRSVPSASAIVLLEYIQADPKNQANFVEKIWIKTVPSQAQIEAMERFQDDGREVIDLIDRIKRERDRAEQKTTA